MSAQISAWCFTTYKVGSELTVPDSFKWFRYCVYQKEKCPTTQRVHFQGYIEFTRSVRMNKVKTLFNDKTMHLEPNKDLERMPDLIACLKHGKAKTRAG